MRDDDQKDKVIDSAARSLFGNQLGGAFSDLARRDTTEEVIRKAGQSDHHINEREAKKIIARAAEEHDRVDIRNGIDGSHRFVVDGQFAGPRLDISPEAAALFQEAGMLRSSPAAAAQPALLKPTAQAHSAVRQEQALIDSGEAMPRAQPAVLHSAPTPAFSAPAAPLLTSPLNEELQRAATPQVSPLSVTLANAPAAPAPAPLTPPADLMALATAEAAPAAAPAPAPLAPPADLMALAAAEAAPAAAPAASGFPEPPKGQVNKDVEMNPSPEGIALANLHGQLMQGVMKNDTATLDVIGKLDGKAGVSAADLIEVQKMGINDLDALRSIADAVQHLRNAGVGGAQQTDKAAAQKVADVRTPEQIAAKDVISV